MEHPGGVQQGSMMSLLESKTIENLESNRRIVVRASPKLFFTPVLSEWTPFANRDWNDTEISPQAHAAHSNTQSLHSVNAGDGYKERAASKEIDSPPQFMSSGKLGSMNDPYPCGNEKPQNHLKTTGDAGSGILTPKKTKTKQWRYKYDDQIDPNLPPMQKKKLRRILANRVSARRSRQRKKEAFSHLLHREKELIEQRDSAVAGLNQQIRINAAIRQELQAMQGQLAMYHKAKIEAMIPQLYGEADRCLSSSLTHF